jgi:hypothetical protein
MAKSPTGAAASAGSKPKAPRGPIKRVFHIFYKATDENGNPASGVKISIDRVMSDARKVVDFMDSPEAEGLKRFKYEVISVQRADGTTEEEGKQVA